ncbi:MAG: hypothetical protein AB9903_35550 [Vulcanimicrobiota bacterium]
MKIFTRKELEKLTEINKGPCISIYMPTHRAGRETEQDPIRFKNLVNDAEKHLQGTGLTGIEVEKTLAPAHKLHQDSDFWRHQSDGLALFLAPGVSHHYRLPFRFEESVVVDNSFHVKPLMPLLAGDSLFYMLALSQNEVRIFQGTRYGAQEIFPEDLPESVASILYGDFEKQTNYHSGTPRGRGGRPAIHHGQGGANEESKDNILRFFQKINTGLHDLLKGETAPLLVASVEYLLPLYRKANTYTYLMDEGLSGNPEELSAEKLHEKAWAIVQPYFQKSPREMVTK